MSALTNTNLQVINGVDGNPAFVVIPYADYLATLQDDTIPHAVVHASVRGATMSKAWREHLGLTQAEVAARMGISQSAYAQHEASDKLRKNTLLKIAKALGISIEQLDC